MSDHSEIILTGGCACGHVKYASTFLPQKIVNCYCQTCRRLGGAPFMTFADIPTNSLTWTSGPSSYKERSYSDIGTRKYCAECGSPLSLQFKFDMDNISLVISSIDEGSVKGTIPPVGKHIFVDSAQKIGGFELPADGKPRFGKLPKEFEDVVGKWRKSLTAQKTG